MQNPVPNANGDCVEALARDLLTRPQSSRMPTVAQYQERLGVGSGTVQARLHALEAVGAIKLHARGRQGTFIVERNVGELWSVARLGPVRGVMPIPEAFEPACLAVTVRREFQRLNVPLELLYLHGAASRLQLVREGAADFATLSAPAAQEITTGDDFHWASLGFGSESYHRDGAMVVIMRPRAGVDDRIVRVGIDPDSLDHSLITKAEFPADAGYVYSMLSHRRLPAAVAEGAIDAAVWHSTSLAIPLSAVGIDVRPLHEPAAIDAARQAGHAVLMLSADRPEVGGLLATLDLALIREVQEEALQTDVLPLF